MAWDFDGTNDMMEGDLGVTYSPPITMACWFNSDTTATNTTLLTFNNGSDAENLSQSLSLRLVSTGFPRVASSSGAGNTLVTGTTPYQLNKWHHIVGTFPSTTSRSIWFDGILENSNTTESRVSNPRWVIIGNGSGGTYSPNQYYNGRLAEIAIWTAVLNADEIMSLAKGIKPIQIRPQSLLVYIPLIKDIQEYSSGIKITNNATQSAFHTRRYG